MSQFQVPRGTQDLFGSEINKWHYIEEKIRQFVKLENLKEIRTPEFEHTEVFKRDNDSSDVVNKEMYTFLDNGNRSLTLKPEGTAGLVRSYVSNKLYSDPEPLHQYYYVTPAFRYERPQQGRMRIHHQFGVEMLGEKSPLVDVKCLLTGLSFIKSLGLTQFEVHINTLGDEESRNNYKQALKEYFKPVLHELCSDCHRRYEQNPLRILDCKVDADHPSLINAPKLSDYLNKESKEYFETVLKLLKEFNIPVVINDKLVRGLDYYTHTVFEVISTHPNAGSQATIFGGGRYDNLVSDLGGPSVSSIGFGMGIERLILRLENEDLLPDFKTEIDVYGISLDAKSQVKMIEILTKLREKGITSDMDYGLRSLKAQFKSSDRLNAKYILILGENELSRNEIVVKNTQLKSQNTVSLSDILSYFEKEFVYE